MYPYIQYNNFLFPNPQRLAPRNAANGSKSFNDLKTPPGLGLPLLLKRKSVLVIHLKDLPVVSDSGIVLPVIRGMSRWTHSSEISDLELPFFRMPNFTGPHPEAYNNHNCYSPSPSSIASIDQ